MKDREAEERLSNYFEMFRSNGWAQLTEDLSENAQAINSIETTQTEQDLFFRKGQLAVIAQILNFPAVIDKQQQDLEEDDEDAL